MHQFKSAGKKWWNKPLVKVHGKELPAELVVLQLHLQPDEEGVWFNSRRVTSGVFDLIQPETKDGKYKTQRMEIPKFVTIAIQKVYTDSGLSKGCPDVVIWNSSTLAVRLIEVKNPHWDRPSKEQLGFMKVAEKCGIMTEIAEWEFADG